MQRQALVDRIDQRVERMFAAGAVAEVRALTDRPLSRTARGMIGIKEIQGYLQGAYGLARAKELIKIHTRQYAKRQMTWFRREQRVNGSRCGLIRELQRLPQRCWGGRSIDQRIIFWCGGDLWKMF